jgi:DNA-binding XRE family transcriptional regulator
MVPDFQSGARVNWEMDMVTVPHSMAVLRARLRLDQYRFAALVGLSAGTIAKIEQRKYTPAPWRVECRLAAELDCWPEMARALVAGDMAEADVLVLAVHVNEGMLQGTLGKRIGGCHGKNEKHAVEPVSAGRIAQDAGLGGQVGSNDAERSQPDRTRQTA